jgi:hypothetical protein
MAITKVNDVLQFTNEAGTREYAEIISTVAIDPATGNVQGSTASTGATTSVASSATAVTIKAANALRIGLTIANDSTSILYILLGAGTVSATNYTYALPAKGTTAADRTITGFTGVVTGIWATANGSALVTELT